MHDATTTPTTLRGATAVGRISVGEPGAALLRAGGEGRAGDVLGAASAAARMAAKQTPLWLPHGRSLPPLDVEVDLRPEGDVVHVEVRVQAIAAASLATEALAAVSAAALCVQDLLRPHVTDALVIDGIRVTDEAGGAAQFARSAAGRKAVVIVLSDSVAVGRKPDTAGRAVVDGLEQAGFEVAGYEALPDDPDALRARLDVWLQERADLIVTVGGTGVGPRDQTVETVRPLLTAELPGLMEAARAFGQARTPYAVLSRGIAGLVGSTVIVTFPGSRRGAEETLAAIRTGLVHLVEVLHVANPHPGGYS